MSHFLDTKLLSIIEDARKDTELKISNSNMYQPDVELKKSISEKFRKFSFTYN